MAIIIKTNPSCAVQNGTAEFSERPYKKPHINRGDEVFVWESEAAGGIGLSFRGRIEAVDPVPGEVVLRVRVAVDAAKPQQRFDVNHLRAHRDSSGNDPIVSLSHKLYRHALNKIAALDTQEAAFLNSLFTSRVGAAP